LISTISNDHSSDYCQYQKATLVLSLASTEEEIRQAIRRLIEEALLMEIRNKANPDPVTDLYLVDAYMRWALMASEEVVGKNGLNVILR
jgi:hypothetical protein